MNYWVGVKKLQWKEGKNVKRKVRAPHGRSSCNSVWGLYFYIYIDFNFQVIYYPWSFLVKIMEIFEFLSLYLWGVFICVVDFFFTVLI